MKHKNNIVFLSLFIPFFFSGCLGGSMNEYNKLIGYSEDMKVTTGTDKLKETEINNPKKFISLRTPKKVSKALEELSRIENKPFMLENKEMDFELRATSHNFIQINNYFDLKQYIEDTSDKTLVITKNEISLTRPKMIRIVDKEALNADFSKVQLKVSGAVTVQSALQKAIEKIGYSVVYSYDLESTTNNTINSTFENTLSNENIYFSGNSLRDFLSYISQLYNIYVDVDYSSKTITLSKYKTKMFDLMSLNHKVKVQNAKQDSTSSTGNGTTTESIESEADIAVVDEFVENLNTIVGTNTTNTNGRIAVNKSSGQVFVKASKADMQEISLLIDRHNKAYSTQVEVGIEVYEFVVEKDFNLGIDLSYSGSNLSVATSSVTESILTAITKGRATDINLKLGSQNQYARMAKNYTFKKILTSNIPDSISLLNQKDYVKKTNTVTTTNTSTTTSSDTEIATVNDGVIITILPRVVDDSVAIQSEVSISAINSLLPKTMADGNTIYMPDKSNKTIPSNVVIFNGNRKVIGVYQTYQNVSNYNGAVPIEDFIIGGESGKQFVKKEIILVAQASILN